MSGTIVSAAALESLPRGDDRWVVCEWFGAVAVGRSLARSLPADRWRLDGEYAPLDVAIVRPIQAEPGPHEEAGSAYEYRDALFAERPMAIAVPLERVTADMGAWFGELADERVGGAIALLALSGASPGSPEVILRNPAALGLRLDEGETSLATLRRRGIVHVVARGVSWGDLDSFDLVGTGLEDLGAEAHDLVAHASAGPSSYGVCLRISVDVDPEILVDTGVVFEQQSVNGVQTLATAGSWSGEVDVGMIVPVALPAWCLNQSLAAPGGQPVRPTPLVLPVASGMSQQEVWAGREEVLDRLRPW